ncbi:MAG: serine hydrolase [Saprospiraceae bacterium]|nr:serine hydrolase [Saprospiraceae bacterium]
MKHLCLLLSLFLFTLIQCTNPHDQNVSADSILSEDERLIQRADSFELNMPYEPVPGDSLSYHASGFAKILCSAVFISGLDFDFAAENIGYFTAPYKVRSQLKRSLDLQGRAVHVTLPNGVVRTAKYFGDQGCICLPEGKDSLFYTPVKVESKLSDPEKTAWPIGDELWISTDLSIDAIKVRRAVDTVFTDPELLTAAFLVTYKGQIIGERYRVGIDQNTRLEGWSMGKSLTATLMGVLIQQGVYSLNQPAPIPEWQMDPDDPRSKITISDILHMSSGLRFRAPLDPDFDPHIGYPDHLYVYTGAINSFHWAATRPQQWPSNTIGRYRNSDPVLINYLIRLGVEGRGQNYWNFPQQELFDKIGVRNMVMETDPYGNFLLQGYEFGTARDWARLGNLYLNDGISNGERILPEGFIEFVSTLAPAWQADGRLIYGAFFWINGDGNIPIPKDAYFMAGAGGQYTFIIPSYDLVVVMLTHYKGGSKIEEVRNAALAMLLEAVDQ